MDGAATFGGQPRTVDGGRGVAWWSEGWALFAKAAVLWILFSIILVILLVVMQFIPLVGTLAAALLLPVFLGGWMLAARKVQQGGTLEVGDLFACFQGDRLTPLIVVGVLLLAGVIVIGLALGVLGAGAIFGAALGVGSGSARGVFAALGSLLLVLLVCFALSTLLTMATWFAPALVVFRNVPPVEALKQSFSASLKNIVPFLLWGLIYIVAAIAASIPLGLGWIVLIPVTLLTAYVSYQDVFGDAAA